MHLLELTNYRISSSHENSLMPFHFALAPNERCCIETDSQQHARQFLKALATLIPPVEGAYQFDGQTLNFSDYRDLLPVKKKIGYLAPDATLISNRSVLDNLLLMRYYFENRFKLAIDEETEKLCRRFDLLDKLKMRPAELNPLDFNIAIAIRELSKSPKLLLLERPENLIGDHHLDRLTGVLNERLLQNLPIVFISYNQSFNAAMANKKALITERKLATGTIPAPS